MKKIFTNQSRKPLTFKDFDFQKVYEVSGKSAKDIEVAFGELKFNIEESKLNKFSAALDLIVGENTKSKNTGKIVCDISPKLLPRVNENFDGDIILEAKEGRYRLTIINMVSETKIIKALATIIRNIRHNYMHLLKNII